MNLYVSDIKLNQIFLIQTLESILIKKPTYFCIIIKNNLSLFFILQIFYANICKYVSSRNPSNLNFRLMYLNNYKTKGNYIVLCCLRTTRYNIFVPLQVGKFHTDWILDRRNNVPLWYIVPSVQNPIHLIPRGSYTFSNYLTVRNLCSSNPLRPPALPIYIYAAKRKGKGNHCDSVCLEIYSAIFRRHLHGRGWPILNLPINFERVVYILYTRHSEIYR